ncbi:MAG: hypothetical protein KC505_04255 [Myxococcales bacterium]|nr:hypothetical protein [Myxococcales bacterium]USN50217.1 MAG: hypothetical protein H6731_08085 [Myxococcales bacterium]
MARERGSRDSEAFPEPDMLPLMNIILMLILALITMAALLPLGLISSESQKLSKGGPAPSSTEEKPLNAIVFITEAGFNISIYGDVKMGANDPKNPGRKLALIPVITLPDGTTEFDFVTLQSKLYEYKKADSAKYKRDEQSMTITADPEIKFDTIVQSMDAVRFDAQKEILFPKVSFAAGMVG